MNDETCVFVLTKSLTCIYIYTTNINNDAALLSRLTDVLGDKVMDEVTTEAETNQGDIYHIRLKWLQFGLIIILFPISCFGNLLTIVSVAANYHLRKKRNVLIVSLAVADITSLAVYLIITANAPSGDYVRTNHLNMNVILVTTTVYISAIHIVFIGIERIIAITRPLHYVRIFNSKTIVVMVITVWIVPPITLIPGYWYAISTTEAGYETLLMILYSVCVASYLVLTISLCSIYGKILRDATLQANKVHQMTTQFAKYNKVNKLPGKKAVKLVMSILICFTLSYFPYMLFCVMKLYLQNTDKSQYNMELLDVLATFFVQVNATLNAGVYAASQKVLIPALARRASIGINTVIIYTPL